MTEITQYMPPPPENTYHSFEDAEDACQQWAKEQCDRARVYKSTAQVRKRVPSKQAAYLSCGST
jgi:hypothetical protein